LKELEVSSTVFDALYAAAQRRGNLMAIAELLQEILHERTGWEAPEWLPSPEQLARWDRISARIDSGEPAPRFDVQADLARLRAEWQQSAKDRPKPATRTIELPDDVYEPLVELSSASGCPSVLAFLELVIQEEAER
jgi:hypothetical protein